MTFLRARRNDLTSLFWADLAEDIAGAPDAPRIVTELARGDVSVVCDPQEADEALDWARARPYWPSQLAPEHEPMYVHDSATG